LEVGGIDVVAEACDGVEALHLCRVHRPDVVVLDIEMPKLGGFDVVVRLRASEHQPGIVVLSAHEERSYVLRAVELGIRAYLLKSAADDDLVPAIHAVVTGRSLFSPAVTAVLIDSYARRRSDPSDSYASLTEREKQIFRLLAEGRVNKDVAVILDLSVATVEAHRYRLMRKLNVHNGSEIVLYAMRKGLIA
jgi:DNA-binding NarL/FixJ family response regulator